MTYDIVHNELPRWVSLFLLFYAWLRPHNIYWSKLFLCYSYALLFSTLFLLANPIDTCPNYTSKFDFTHYVSPCHLPDTPFFVFYISLYTSSFGPVVSKCSQFTCCFTCLIYGQDQLRRYTASYLLTITFKISIQVYYYYQTIPRFWLKCQYVYNVIGL